MTSRSQWQLLDVVEALGCAVYGPIGDDAELARIPVGHVTIDSRLVEQGSVFVALQGTREHGMRHAVEAFERGAAAVLAGTDLEVPDDAWEDMLGAASEGGPVLVATDCDGVTALGRLGRARRRRSTWRVVGITGSSGKTGTKDLLRVLLRRAGSEVWASHANHNNEIGVPLTLLDAPDTADVVICEMGMRGAGQIAWLCDIADPDVGIVTTAGTAHLELLGSPAAIVAAKAELLAGTWRGGVGIFPVSQPELVESAERVPDRMLPFGVGPAEQEAAVLVTSLERIPEGIAGTIDLAGEERAFSLPLHGLHHARNLAAAAAALLALTGSATLLSDDVLLLDGVDAAEFTRGRGDRQPLVGGGFVVDDAYNANPESMRAAIDELAASAAATGPRIAVLGRMAELGASSAELHAQVGAYAAAQQGVDRLVVVGADADVLALAEGWRRARGSGSLQHYDDVAAALGEVEAWHEPGAVVLVKASNSSGLAALAAGLAERFGSTEAVS